MKVRLFLLLAGAMLFLTACILTAVAPTAAPTALVFPTLTTPSATSTPVVQVPPTGAPSAQPPATTVPATAVPATAVPTAASAVTPGAASGPYAVFNVQPNDALNVRAGPGVSYGVIDTLAYNATGVYRSGPSSPVDGDLWVQIARPSGGTGWVNDFYLIEFVTPVAFCADARVTSLIADFKRAVQNRDGTLLASLVSPKHGLAIALYRLNDAIVFHANDARWVFESTYAHDWGPHPARGDDEVGSFQDKVLPRLVEVFNASYQQLCEERGAVYQPAWPERWANLRVMKLYKPATDPNTTLDFRIWLTGIEYVNGRPYLAGLVHIEWEP